MIRDHTNGVLYFQAYGDLAWAKLSVSAALQNRTPISEDYRNATGLEPVMSGLETYAIPINAGDLGFSAGDALGKF